MMRKVLVLLFATTLVFGFSGQASAIITPSVGDLNQYIYEGTSSVGTEFATNLGSGKTGELSSQYFNTLYVDYDPGPEANGQMNSDLGTIYDVVGTPSTIGFSTVDWDQLYAGFVGGYTTGNALDFTETTYFATTSSATPNLDLNSYATFSQNAVGMATSPLGPQNKAEAVSYWGKIEALSGQGTVAGFVTDGNGVVNLGALDGDGAGDTDTPIIGTYVDLYLWNYFVHDGYSVTREEGFVDVAGEFADTYVATIRIGIESDGQGGAQLYTEINPVPIPGGALLLGSGLLGLIGGPKKKALILKSKMTKNNGGLNYEKSVKRNNHWCCCAGPCRHS